MRCITRLALVALTSCAQSEGDPWATVEPSLWLQLEIPESRQTDEGNLKTSTGFEVANLQLSMIVDGVTIRQGAADALESFDPQNPPPQYSLCHNGHCHHDDGRLVDYEDIAAELSVSQSGASVSAVSVDLDPVVVSGTPVPVLLAGCPCDLGRGSLAAAEVSISWMRVQATVFDGSGGAPRVPANGLEVDVELAQTLTLIAPLEVIIDNHRKPEITLELTARLTPKLLDGVPWSEANNTPTTIIPAVVAVLDQESSLTAAIQRNHY